MQSDPLVSIIVRTKDRPALLREALDSLAAQTHPRLEVIVVNDGGVDVEELVRGYRTRFSAWHYRNLHPGRGRSAAGNAGLDAAGGDYVGFLDDDDWLLPEHVACLVAALADRPERAAYSGVRCLEESNGEWREVRVFNQPFDHLRLCCGNYIPIHGVLFERSMLASGCRLDEALDAYEDWDFWLQVAERTPFVHVDRITACYRIHPGSEFGVETDGPERLAAQQSLYRKWLSRWNPEILVRLIRFAREGVERPYSGAHLRNLERLLAERDGALAAQRVHVANLERLIRDRDRALADKEVHVANLERLIRDRDRALAAQRVHVANLERLLAERDGVLAALQSHASRLEAAHQALRQEADHWRTAYQMVITSTSWRVSAPVRGLGRALRRVAAWIRRRSHVPRLHPAHQLEVLGRGRFRALGPDPHFRLEFEGGRCPSRWILVEARLVGERELRPEIYYNAGEGFNERHRFALRALGQDRFRALARLPDQVHGLRLDPLHGTGRVEVAGLTLTEVGSLEAGWRLFGPRLLRLLRDPGRWRSRLMWLLRTYRQHGWHGTKQLVAGAVLREENEDDYATWFGRHARLTEVDRERIRAHLKGLAYRPRISVLMPVYNPAEKWLRSAIGSVRAQLYPDWELCIADDASTVPHVRRVLEEFRRSDARIRVVYRDQNGHIAAASNSALALASGDFVALLDHDDELAEHALYLLAVELNRHPEAALLYSDEDKIDARGRHFDPYFKPDWNPLLLLGQNYLNHLTAYRTDLVHQAGGFRVGFEGSQDWDLALRASALIRAEQVRHLPFVLYHWRAVSGSTAASPGEKDYAARSAVRAVTEHLHRRGQAGRVESLPGGHCRVRLQLPDTPPAVSLIIPTRDGYDLLHRCVETLVTRTVYPDYEVIVVDNQSGDPRTLAYLDRLARRPRFTVLRYTAPFNFSAINNDAARHARGEVLGFLNNDLEILTPDWLEEMVSHAVDPGTGAVGAMLYYPDGHIQHAGVILGIGGVAGHAYQGFPRGYPGQMGRARLTQNLSAVTAACLLVRRRVFEEVGGFDEKALAVAFNDVDLCLKIQRHGYRNVWTPVAELNHHESATRGYEDTPEKQLRFRREIEVMQRRWGKVLRADPAYNPNLTLERCDFSPAAEPRVRKPWEDAQDGRDGQPRATPVSGRCVEPPDGSRLRAGGFGDGR